MKSSAIIIAMTSAVASAQPAHLSDFIVKIENNRIVTGRVEDDQVIFGPRHVGSILGDAGIPAATFNPGFEAVDGGLPAVQLLGLTIRRALRIWNGQAFVEMTQPNAPYLRITKGISSVSTPSIDPPDCSVGENLVLGVTNPVGNFHEHPGYQLINPVDGVYLFEFQLWISNPGNGMSTPAYITFSQNAASTFPSAFAWADARFGSPHCTANCDGSSTAPILTANDFSCFLTAYAGGLCAANCDESTAPPLLNANDFTCFLNRFVQGCP
jgi:hypothetical protein